MKKISVAKTTEYEVESILKKYYKAPEYAFLPQVRNQTGYGKSVRTADVLALGLYPSRGLYLHGFEIKTWRADWLQELKNPDKADDICSYCHFWYVAINDEKVAKLDEIPENWGLLLCAKGTRKILKKAPKRENVTSLDIQMIAGMLRKAADLIGPAGELQTAEDKGRQEAETRLQAIIDHHKYEQELLQQKLQDFEAASGVRIDQWGKTGSEIGAAIKVVLSGGYGSYSRHLERTKNDLQRTIDDLNKVIQELRRLNNPKGKLI